MTVLARTRYQWGEFIWARHAAQYDWLLLPLAVLMVSRSGTRGPAHGRWLVCAVTVAVLGARAADIGGRLLAVTAARPAIERMVQGGVVDQGAFAQVRQMFRAYQSVPALAFVTTVRDNGCVVRSNIKNVLSVQYDMFTAEYGGTAAIPDLPPSLVLIAAMNASAGTMPVPPDTWPELVIDHLPKGLHVFSNQPEVCLKAVNWAYRDPAYPGGSTPR